MKYEVQVVEDAEIDLFEIYNYISENDALSKAEYVYNKITEKILNLESLPERGHKPAELVKIGIHNYLEIHFKPYRIIYHIEGNMVYVDCVLDGRRDLEDLLQHRLIR